MSAPDRPATFFETADKFREWLEENHKSKSEFWVGFYKTNTGIPSLTWPESVDQALCFGWIDGLRQGIDEQRYRIRFIPRRPGSIWSNINVAKVEALLKGGLMAPDGIAAYEKRKEKRSGIYSYERPDEPLAEAEESVFRANVQAWAFFESQPPSYRKQAAHWVGGAKSEAVRSKRLNALIELSAEGKLLYDKWRKKKP